MSSAEIFRRGKTLSTIIRGKSVANNQSSGPTIEFANSLRGSREEAGPGKQVPWKSFSTRQCGKGDSKFVELSQNWTSNTMRIRLDKYQPMDTDKQYYPWFDNCAELHYQTPAYGIAKLEEGTSSIERFLAQNFDTYIEAHMRGANEITRKTFETVQNHKVCFHEFELLEEKSDANTYLQHLPLVERCLKLWVACRFIEEPWSITGSETLGMSHNANPNCPYHKRIPVPPIVDLQIDLIVINRMLQPEMREITRMLKTMLKSSDPWTNWFEIYLAYFVLLHNVELTMAHDAWFVKRNNLKVCHSRL